MQVTYWYPYIGYGGKKYKYGTQDYDADYVWLGNAYVHPLTTNNPIPNVSKLKFSLWIGARYYYEGLFNSYWDIYALTSDGWVLLKRITSPNYTDIVNPTDDDRYEAEITFDIELSTKRTIIKVAPVPSSPPRGVTWSVSYIVKGAEITEDIPDAVLTDSGYFCGIQEKKGDDLASLPRKIDVNIGGKLVGATEVMVNVDEKLIPLPKMQQYNFVATANEQSAVITFTPKRTGEHTIDATTQYAGSTSESNAVFKVYDSEMNELMPSYKTKYSLVLEEGKEYRIIVIDEPSKTDLAQRVIKIYYT